MQGAAENRAVGITGAPESATVAALNAIAARPGLGTRGRVSALEAAGGPRGGGPKLLAADNAVVGDYVV